MAPPRQSRRSASSVRRTVANLHAWSGAFLSVFILLVAASGAASVFLGSWFELQYPELRGAAIDRGARAEGDYLPAEALVDSAVDGFGRPFLPLGLLMPRTRVNVDAASVYGLPAGAGSEKEALFLNVNPYTGEFLGSFVLDDAFGHELVHFHAQLLAGAGGELAVAVLGLLLFAFSVSGLYLWWPGRAAASSKLRRWRSGSGRWPSRLYALHSLSGFWLCLLVAFWSLSGTATAEPSWFGLERAYSAVPAAIRRADAEECDADVGLETAIDLADAEISGRRLAGIEFPNPGRAAWLVTYLGAQDWNRVSGDRQVWVHARCAGVVETVDVANAGIATRLGDAMFSLHSGRSFGLFGQALTVVTGCMLGFLAVSGLIVWWRLFLRGSLARRNGRGRDQAAYASSKSA